MHIRPVFPGLVPIIELLAAGLPSKHCASRMWPLQEVSQVKESSKGVLEQPASYLRQVVGGVAKDSQQV